MRSVREWELRSSGDLPTITLIQTAASVFTMETTWSLLTWFPRMEKRHGPGLLALNTFWQASVMRTVWQKGNGHEINILLIVSTEREGWWSESTHSGLFQFVQIVCACFLTSCCKWLRQTFSEADKNGDGNLSIGEVLQLLHKLNVNLPKQKVREMFQVHYILSTLVVCAEVWSKIKGEKSS